MEGNYAKCIRHTELVSEGVRFCANSPGNQRDDWKLNQEPLTCPTWGIRKQFSAEPKLLNLAPAAAPSRFVATHRLKIGGR